MPLSESVRGLFNGVVGVGVLEGDDARSFERGRAAAALALADLGAEPVEIPAGPGGAPAWPAGLVGSIAHTRDIAIAVAGRVSEFASLGVDVEPAGRRIDPRTARRVCTPEELLHLDDPALILALFCAKEATYKALAPLGATRLGFQDVSYTRESDGLLAGRIVNEAVDAPVPRALTARYVESDGFVVATMQVDR